jgi:hypothetical protein
MISNRWLYFLDRLIPERAVGIFSIGEACRLIGKGFIDSFVWGVLSNSVGIIGRRILEGDTYAQAAKIWYGKIINVTLLDFQFWPLWSVINFEFLPKKLQVSFTALGAIVWNVYISLVANWEAAQKSSQAAGRVAATAAPVDSSSHGSHQGEVKLDDVNKWQRVHIPANGPWREGNDDGSAPRGYQSV